MRHTLVLFVMSAALVVAADSKTAVPAGLPKGAVMSAPYTWKYTDAKGKKWVYRQTPFGFSKSPDVPEPAPVPDATPTKVTDQGDSVKFERKTPFGVESWTKNKADLTAEDKALVERAKSQEKQ